MKWFWLSFFAFLMVLILAFGFWRPDLLENAAVFIGWYLATLLGIVLLGVAVGGALAGWLAWRRGQLVSLRQKDGAYPLQRVKLKGGVILYFDPNQTISPATMIHPTHGLIEIAPVAGWDVQLAVRLAVERTRQLEAMYPGDDARTNRYGASSDVPRLPSWKMLSGESKAQRALAAPREPEVIDVEPAPASTPWRIDQAFDMSTRTELPMGQTAGADLVRWNLVESPHLRVHGKSQGSGKTNLIRTLAAGALRSGHHVIVCDRRRFKDWGEFRDKAELIDVSDPARFVAVAEQLATIYRERDQQLGAVGAPNIAQLRNAPARIVVVIAEFGALCAQADADGVLQAMLHPLTMILREAGAAGVHVVIEDQVVDQRWPRGISTNAEPITGYLPQNYGAAGGYYDAHKLPAYTFHYCGAVFNTWDTRSVMGGLLARIQGRMEPVIDGRSARSVERGEGGLPLERTPPNGEPNARPNGEPNATDDLSLTDLQEIVWAWRGENPSGSQAELRRQLGERGIDISRGYAHELWHRWPGAAMPTQVDLSTEEGRALLAQWCGDARLPGGERIGVDVSRGER